MKIVTASALWFWLSLSALATSTPAPTPAVSPSPAASSVAGQVPTPAPTPDPDKACYLQVSEPTLATQKECEKLDSVGCSKAFKTCKWHNYERQCLGLIYYYCSSTAPKGCEKNLVGVTEFPPKLKRTNLKFKCHEKSPVKLIPLKK